MKHEGKARQSAFRMIKWTLILLLLIIGAGIVATLVGGVIAIMATSLIGVWFVFAIFTLYFFRDPTPDVPMESGLIVAPGHGKVDVIDTTDEMEFMGGRCQRISIFLSVFDVHVQQAPVAGRVTYYKYKRGEFVNAMKTECADLNENALIGFEATEPKGAKVGVRLIAGLIARRIVPWVTTEDEVDRGERISLIQFGSRVNLYLPLNTTITVKLGDRVKGGETVVAKFK